MMDRLTKRVKGVASLGWEGGTYFKMEKLTPNCSKHYCRRNVKCLHVTDRTCLYLRLIDSLAAYEDTNLTPAEMTDHEEMFKAYRHICGGKSPEEISETIKAKEERRPCEFCEGYGKRYGPAFRVEYFKQTAADDGIDIDIDALFCPHCGRKLISEAAEAEKERLEHGEI